MKNKIGLFFTGFIQVFFVVINTWMVSRNIFLGVLLASFTISFVWTLNVKKVAFGGWADRITYSVGAAAGSVSGLASSAFVLQILIYFFE